MPATTEAPDTGVHPKAHYAYYGRVIIEWPAPGRSGALPGWGCSILDAETGQQVVTVSRVSVTADAEDAIRADLTMFADDNGMPVLFPDIDGNLTIWQAGDGDIKTGTFLFLVAEMRVRAGSIPA